MRVPSTVFLSMLYFPGLLNPTRSLVGQEIERNSWNRDRLVSFVIDYSRLRCCEMNLYRIAFVFSSRNEIAKGMITVIFQDVASVKERITDPHKIREMGSKSAKKNNEKG